MLSCFVASDLFFPAGAAKEYAPLSDWQNAFVIMCEDHMDVRESQKVNLKFGDK